MKETPIFGFSFPDPTDAPDGAAQIQEAVKDVEKLLSTIELLLGTVAVPAAPKAGDLIVVNGTADPVYRAMTGAATISSAGIIGIGNEKVETAHIKQLAIETLRLAEEAVTTAKLAGLSVTEGKLAALAVSAGKIAAEAVETGKIKNLAVTEAKIAAEAVSDAKLASPNNAIWRTIMQGQAIFSLKKAAGFWLLMPAAGAAVKGSSGNFAAGPPVPVIGFDPADYAVAGKTGKMRIIAQALVNSYKPTGVTFTPSLRAVGTSVGGAVDEMAIAETAAKVTGPAIVAPALENATTAAGAEVNMPAAGAFYLAVTTNANLPENSVVQISAQVQIRHV